MNIDNYDDIIEKMNEYAGNGRVVDMDAFKGLMIGCAGGFVLWCLIVYTLFIW